MGVSHLQQFDDQVDRILGGAPGFEVIGDGVEQVILDNEWCHFF